MSDSIFIREAGPADFPAVYEMIREFAEFQHSSDKFVVSLQNMLEASSQFNCFIAETEQKEIIGYTTCFPAYYTWTGKAIYLDDIFVREQFRGKKIGSRLMDQVFDLARKEGCTKVRWQVSNWNKEAIAFYRSLGASVDDVELNCDLPL
jgi:GNAT superfamily N-acetyltransferase